ncbi:MAG: DUF4835 family protein [Bacteroidota bacterium]
MNVRRTLTCLLFAAMIVPCGINAQEVDCTVQVNYEAIPSTNKDLLHDFANDIRTYLSNYNWGPGSSTDKVSCTLNIFLQSVTGENRYSAQVFIGSSRPIYKSEQSTAVTRLFDEQWEFTYVRNRPLNHNSYSFNDLTSFLDFYMYLVLGYDYDTYERLSGTPLFQKASDVASLGRSSGQKGWQQGTTSYSRTQLIEELLNPTFEQVRAASWTYHFCGLDSLAIDKERGYANLIRAVQAIGAVRQKVDPRNLVIKTFFDAKAKELADVFLDYPDPRIYSVLNNADPSHTKTYEEALQKRQQ